MTLPAGERRKLRAIERSAVSADSGLAARFAIFNQLTRHDEMPTGEQLTARRVRRKKWAERAAAAYLISGPDTLWD
jgi:hypothetical protein